MTLGVDLGCVLDDVTNTLEGIASDAPVVVAAFVKSSTGRLFVTGQGRSGLAGRMAAMRFMHVGIGCHFVGESTAPAIGRGDRLLTISQSGEKPVSQIIASEAKRQGARICAITAQPESALARLADLVVAIPRVNTTQHGSSPFEQAALLLLDAVVLNQVRRDPTLPDLMRRRHTNLE